MNSEGMIWAVAFGGNRTQTADSWAKLDSLRKTSEWTWVHLDYEHERAESWIREGAGMEEDMARALLDSKPRPRYVERDNGLMLILRAANFNDRSEVEDMVAVRIWIDSTQIITLRHRRIMSADTIRAEIERGRLPRSPSQLFAQLTAAITQVLEPIALDMDEALDQIEEDVIDARDSALQTRINSVRRRVVHLRRHLTPQRDAVDDLSSLECGWLDADAQKHLSETRHRIARLLEEIDLSRERANVAMEELRTHMAEKGNRIVFMLSVISGIFLPLSLISGMLGMNVGGIPWTDNPNAFLGVSLAFLVMTVVLIGVAIRSEWWK